MPENKSDTGRVSQELDALSAEFGTKAKSNPALQNVFKYYGEAYEKETARLLNAVKVGDAFPDFTLPNALGKQTSLSKLLASGPVVVTFYRGSWCPFCNIALAHLQKHLGDIHAAGAQLVAISPSPADDSISLSDKLGLKFEVVSDTENVVASALGTTFTLPEEIHPHYKEIGVDQKGFFKRDTPVYPTPSTFVVNKDGKIAWLHHEVHHAKRADGADVVAALKAL